MPTYEYRCTICEEHFEVFQSFSEDTLKTIKGEEHKHTVKKVFSPVGIAFKGSGFYKNDSSAKKSSSSSSSSSSESTSGDSSSSSSGNGSTSNGSSSESSNGKSSTSDSSSSKKSTADT